MPNGSIAHPLLKTKLNSLDNNFKQFYRYDHSLTLVYSSNSSSATHVLISSVPSLHSKKYWLHPNWIS